MSSNKLRGRNPHRVDKVYLKVAKALALAVETRETYAQGHSERVNLLATQIATQMGCSNELLRDIALASRLHDIGKIAIRDEILFKPEPLTAAEYSEIKRHPRIAIEMLRHLDHFNNIFPIIEAHHEWYNGTGYPNRLKGEEIPLGARILAVADAYDTMTSPRPYRNRLSEEEALQIIREGAGSQWDPKVVDAFLKVIERESRMLQSLAVGF